MQIKKDTETRPPIHTPEMKPAQEDPLRRGFKVRTNLQAGRNCWFIPIGPMGDGCLMCDDGSQYC